MDRSIQLLHSYEFRILSYWKNSYLRIRLGKKGIRLYPTFRKKCQILSYFFCNNCPTSPTIGQYQTFIVSEIKMFVLPFSNQQFRVFITALSDQNKIFISSVGYIHPYWTILCHIRLNVTCKILSSLANRVAQCSCCSY